MTLFLQHAGLTLEDYEEDIIKNRLYQVQRPGYKVTVSIGQRPGPVEYVMVSDIERDADLEGLAGVMEAWGLAEDIESTVALRTERGLNASFRLWDEKERGERRTFFSIGKWTLQPGDRELVARFSGTKGQSHRLSYLFLDTPLPEGSEVCEGECFDCPETLPSDSWKDNEIAPDDPAAIASVFRLHFQPNSCEQKLLVKEYGFSEVEPADWGGPRSYLSQGGTHELMFDADNEVSAVILRGDAMAFLGLPEQPTMDDLYATFGEPMDRNEYPGYFLVTGAVNHNTRYDRYTYHFEADDQGVVRTATLMPCGGSVLNIEGPLAGPGQHTHPIPTGCLEGDCQDGQGVFAWPDGRLYRGTFVDGQLADGRHGNWPLAGLTLKTQDGGDVVFVAERTVVGDPEGAEARAAEAAARAEEQAKAAAAAVEPEGTALESIDKAERQLDATNASFGRLVAAVESGASGEYATPEKKIGAYFAKVEAFVSDLALLQRHVSRAQEILRHPTRTCEEARAPLSKAWNMAEELKAAEALVKERYIQTTLTDTTLAGALEDVSPPFLLAAGAALDVAGEHVRRCRGE